MAKYGPDDVTIEIDDDAGGTLQDVSDHIDTLDGFEIEAIIEQANSFGDTWVEQLFSGIRQANEFTIEGFYDDVATVGSKAMYNNSEGETRSVRFTWGSTNTSSFEAIIRSYRRLPTRDGSLRYSVTFAPTGAVTEA
jgi:hypothetical protein